MSNIVFNTTNALVQMDWLLTAPMTVNRWWRKVSRSEHASLMHNGYIITRPYGAIWHVKITALGRERLSR